MALHVDLGGRAPVETGVGVAEGQVLALEPGEWRGGGNRHGGSEGVQLPFPEVERMNVRYLVTLAPEEKSQLESLVKGCVFRRR